MEIFKDIYEKCDFLLKIDAENLDIFSKNSNFLRWCDGRLPLHKNMGPVGKNDASLMSHHLRNLDKLIHRFVNFLNFFLYISLGS